MYLIGAAHPHKAEAQLLLERLIASGQRLVTDAEVLQEILHRYAAIDKREAITPAFQLLLAVVDDVLAIEKVDVLRAGEIVQNRLCCPLAIACTSQSWSGTGFDQSSALTGTSTVGQG